MSILKHRKGGISMELENKLNEFLADLNVFYRKLQNYHWNVQGKDFFQVHSKLEELYNEINEQIDEVAEHILILGEEPLGTLKDYLEKTNITEAENKKIKFDKQEKIELGKSEILTQGEDITIVAIGKMVAKAFEVKEELEKEGKTAEVINARFLKPFDEQTIINSMRKTKNIITLEDNTIIGGLASKVEELVSKNKENNIQFKAFGLPDKFIEHGKVEELEEMYKLDAKSIVKEINF